MQVRNPASVLPEPVGAAMSVCSPAAMCGHPPVWAAVGPSGNRRSNHARTAGCATPFTSATVSNRTDVPSRGAILDHVSDVYLEVGPKRVFACALDWPGWCRSGKSADDALEHLTAYASRYMPVAVQAGVRFAPSVAGSLKVVDRVRGSATTDFGAPGAVPKADMARLT